MYSLRLGLSAVQSLDGVDGADLLLKFSLLGVEFLPASNGHLVATKAFDGVDSIDVLLKFGFLSFKFGKLLLWCCFLLSRSLGLGWPAKRVRE